MTACFDDSCEQTRLCPVDSESVRPHFTVSDLTVRFFEVLDKRSALVLLWVSVSGKLGFILQVTLNGRVVDREHELELEEGGDIVILTIERCSEADLSPPPSP